MSQRCVGVILEWGDGYVALDKASGGYPTKVSARDAKIWLDITSATNYAERVGVLCKPRLLWVDTGPSNENQS